jgi:hypothetical protein
VKNISIALCAIVAAQVMPVAAHATCDKYDLNCKVKQPTPAQQDAQRNSAVSQRLDKKLQPQTQYRSGEAEVRSSPRRDPYQDCISAHMGDPDRGNNCNLDGGYIVKH